MKARIELCGPEWERARLREYCTADRVHLRTIGEAKVFLRRLWKHVSLKYGKFPGDGILSDGKFLRYGMAGAEIVEDI